MSKRRPVVVVLAAGRGMRFRGPGHKLMQQLGPNADMTADLTAEYPAVAARAMGFNAVPLLCTQEMAVPGSMQHVVRLLMHFYAPEDHTVRHVYQGEARRLRLDIAGAQ